MYGDALPITGCRESDLVLETYLIHVILWHAGELFEPGEDPLTRCLVQSLLSQGCSGCRE